MELPASPTRVALLRGVNVGGRHTLPMARVRQVLDGAGLGPVRSYIQSGNLLLPGGDDPEVLSRRVRGLLEAEAGFEVPVLVVEGERLREVLQRNPFHPEQPKLEHVVFLPAELTGAQQQELLELRDHLAGTDALALGDRVVYLHHPGGLLNSRLAQRAMAALPQGTGRNLATVARLVAML